MFHNNHTLKTIITLEMEIQDLNILPEESQQCLFSVGT